MYIANYKIANLMLTIIIINIMNQQLIHSYIYRTIINYIILITNYPQLFVSMRYYNYWNIYIVFTLYDVTFISRFELN